MSKKKKHNKKHTDHAKEKEQHDTHDAVQEHAEQISDAKKSVDVPKEDRSRDDRAQQKAKIEIPYEILHKKNKTYIAVIILLLGLVCGALFIDVIQLVTQKGFSARAIKDAQVVEYDGYTWVRYDDPKIVVEVFDAEDCTECVTDEVLVRLRSLVPTVEARRIDVRSEEGKRYAQENDIMHIPAFLFDQAITQSDFYQQAAILFTDNGSGKYSFDAPSVGVPIGEYLSQPSQDNGIVLGPQQPQLTMVIFDNPSADESRVMYPIIARVRKDFADQLRVVVKPTPEMENLQSLQMATASVCAQAQEKYDAYANLMFAATTHKALVGSEDVNAQLTTLAQRASLDMDAFNACMNDAAQKEQFSVFTTESKRFGVVAVPTFFINDASTTGVMPYETLKEMVANTLAPPAQDGGDQPAE